MRTLIGLLASLTLCGCGGLDESLTPEAANDAPPALESSSPTTSPEMMMVAKPLPSAVNRTEITLTKDSFRLVQNPVEARFFYPVDLSAPPPAFPLPPCPACR